MDTTRDTASATAKYTAESAQAGYDAAKSGAASVGNAVVGGAQTAGGAVVVTAKAAGNAVTGVLITPHSVLGVLEEVRLGLFHASLGFIPSLTPASLSDMSCPSSEGDSLLYGIPTCVFTEAATACS